MSINGSSFTSRCRRCAFIVSDDDDNTVKRIPTSHSETDNNRTQILVCKCNCTLSAYQTPPFIYLTFQIKIGSVSAIWNMLCKCTINVYDKQVR